MYFRLADSLFTALVPAGITNLTFKVSLKCLLPAPIFLFILSFLFNDKCFNSDLSYLLAISLSWILPNSCTVNPAKDLKSDGGFLDNNSMKVKRDQMDGLTKGHKAVYK